MYLLYVSTKSSKQDLKLYLKVIVFVLDARSLASNRSFIITSDRQYLKTINIYAKFGATLDCRFSTFQIFG